MGRSELGKMYCTFKREIERNLKYRYEHVAGHYLNHLDKVCCINVLLKSRYKSFNELEVRFDSEGNVRRVRYYDYDNLGNQDFPCRNLRDVVRVLQGIAR